MLQKKGFTLIELLAVIVILAIVITISSTSIMSVMRRLRENTAEDMRNNLADSAITYVLEKYKLQKCSEEFSKELMNGNLQNLSVNSSCAKEISVKILKQEGLFEDENGYCKESDSVIVYRHFDGTNSEYKTYIDSSVCLN